MRRSAKSKAGLVTSIVLGLLAVPASAMAGTIAGTVSADSGGAPLQGVEVCPTPHPYTFEVPCTETGADGTFRLSDLPAASYLVYFSTERANLDYVSAFEDGLASQWEAEADLVSVGAAEERRLDAGLVEGGSISGTVTDTTTGLPIGGVRVCAAGGTVGGRCTATIPGGGYRLNGLPGGEYVVEFEAANALNYLRAFYAETTEFPAATKVPVTVSQTTPGIDEAMSPGAQILGHVSDVASGAALAGVDVCALGPPPAEFEDCERTDGAGDYGLRGLPSGTYKVGFGVDRTPLTGALIAGQWWQGADSLTDATPITLSPPQTRAGVDGALESWHGTEDPPLAPIVIGAPAPAAHAPLTARSPAGPAHRSTLHCRKGLRRVTVRGVPRCEKHKTKRAHASAPRGPRHRH